MSNVTTAFSECYANQTAESGVAVLATVTGYATAKPALLTAVDTLDSCGSGTTLESGGFTLEMLISDFSAKPPDRTQVTCNGSATGFALQVTKVEIVNSATYRITVADFNA